MAKVLVVDDSKLSRLMHVNMIQSLGHEAIEANNGQVAIELFERETPDLVITDLLMPQMSGTELIARIRKTNAEIPVLVISADVQHASKDQCRQLGAIAFFNKPLRADEFARYLDRLLCAGGAE